MILPRIKTALLEARTRLWLAWRALTTNHWGRAIESVQAELRRRNELEWQYSDGYSHGFRDGWQARWRGDVQITAGPSENQSSGVKGKN